MKYPWVRTHCFFTKVIIPQVEPLSVYLYNCHQAELFQGEFLYFRLRMSLLHGFLLYAIYFYYTACAVWFHAFYEIRSTETKNKLIIDAAL